MRIPHRLLVVLGATMLATAPLMGVSTSMAQCTITGPTQVCPGDSIELCGTSVDGAAYRWLGPDGILYVTDCILAFDAGLYTLSVRDPVTRVWSPPCSLMVHAGPAAPAITGPTSTCNGTPVNWCGPAGNFEYAWGGPNGFAATTQCVSISAAGEYLLRVRPLPAGCWSDSMLLSLAVTSCGSAAVNCPRPAWWWALQLRGHARLKNSQLASIAGCVDDRSTTLEWSNDLAGFSRAMQFDRRTLRMRARRQFAAVLANACAAGLAVVPASGPPLGLDLATALDASMGGGSVASWLTAADVELANLEGRPERDRSVKEAYRALIRTAWNINHGRGIGTTCRVDLRPDAGMVALEAVGSSDDDLEPLEAELVDDGDGPLVMDALQPNPFRTQTSLAFAVSTSSSADVSIGVYDLSGRLVRELVRGPHAPGQYVTQWDGTDSDGSRVQSGLYFIRGRVGDQQVSSRVTFIR